MYQTWSHLLFMHYSVPVSVLKPYIPDKVELDTMDGMAWIGVVPFLMSRIRFPYTPAVPYLSSFPELNVRTYVKYKNKSGVYFFSCDAKSQLAVYFGKKFYSLPYIYSNIEADFGDQIQFHSQRENTELDICYSPKGSIFTAKQRSLEFFLTERYSLFSQDSKGNQYICEIEHDKWNLQEADFFVEKNTMGSQLNIPLQPIPDHTMYGNETRVYIKKNTFRKIE